MRPSFKKATKHLQRLAFAEALSSIKEKNAENLQKLLIQFEALCNLVFNSTTLLISAIEEGYMQAVNMLLKCDNIDLGVEVCKRTALDAAARKNMPDLVWTLNSLNPKGKPFLSAIEEGCFVSDMSIYDPCEATNVRRLGHAQLAEVLMKQNYSSPEEAARDHRGDYSTAVHLAGSIECLKLVLPYSDVNSVSLLGTPLQAAISFKNFEVAEYLVDQVPEVDFEPESWYYSLKRFSPLILAMKSERRSLVEKLLKSGKCQRTLDSIVNFPTPDELLELYDKYWSGRLFDEEIKPIEITRTQEITYVPPKVSKEEYLSRIFKLLNVPESERVISYTKRDHHLKKSNEKSLFFYEYNLEECPVELMKEYLLNQKNNPKKKKEEEKEFTISYDISQQELLKMVREHIRENEAKYFYPTYQLYHSVPDPSGCKILRQNTTKDLEREFIPNTKFVGYFERNELRYKTTLQLATQNGSREFVDKKIEVNGKVEAHRSHLYNQLPVFTPTNYFQVIGFPGDAASLASVLYRFPSGTVLNAFSSKQIVEKVEDGVELVAERIGRGTNGRIFANNGCVYIFLARRLKDRLDHFITQFEGDNYHADDDDVELQWPLPRLPYQFFLGEFKSNPEAEIAKDRAIIEGIWWESTLEKYSEADVLNEENFGVRGKWKLFAAATDEEIAVITDEIRDYNANVQN